MSDLTASQCGCSTSDNGCCNILIWIILLSCICGKDSGGCGCGMGNGFFGNGCGCGDNSIIWIILLLVCCCNN